MATVIPITTIHGGDRGAITGRVVGGRLGDMDGVDMPALMSTGDGAILPTRAPRQRGRTLTLGITGSRTEPRFKTRSAARWASPAEVPTRTSLQGIRLEYAARWPITPTLALLPAAGPDFPEISTVDRELRAAAVLRTARTQGQELL